jgi:DMSO/TMAO reductase YedYZ molybdopterin-dependent catalytic subunit
MTQSSKVTRRGFLIAITGSAIAAAAGCRADTAPAPTPYVPGSGTRQASTPNAVSASGAKDTRFGQVTYDKLMTTSADDLYITQYDYSRTPDIKADNWKLRIDGLVEEPLTLDYATVKSFPAVESMRALECIGNPVGGGLIGNVVWKGFDFKEILDKIKVKPTATHVKFECEDGYSTSNELKWLTQPDVLMAYEMNGQPLTVKHGFPIRVLIPGLYGQKMPRWITHIEFIDKYYRGYWESNGWSDVADVQTNSIIKTPDDGYATKTGTELAVQGVAWAGKRKITKVEVQIDNGEWMEAKLTRGPSPLAWTQWYLTWTPSAPGTYNIGVRATDETGFVQQNEATGIFGNSAPNGTNAIHRISVVAS